MSSDAPFAGGVVLKGSGARVTIHAPAATIRDIISAVMSAVMGGMGPGMEGPPPGF